MERIAKNWREWLARYGWAELWGILTSYLGYFGALAMLRGSIAASYGASIGENVGYYGCIIWREIASRRRAGQRISPPMFAQTGRDLLAEFGVPELLDSFIVRPAATYLGVAMFGAGTGVLVAKIASDIVFYVLTITLYERRKAPAGEP